MTIPNGAPAKPSDEKEEVYFEGSPVVRGRPGMLLGFLLLALAFIAGGIAGANYGQKLALIAVPVGLIFLFLPSLIIRATRYRITSYRIDFERGIFSKNIDTLELWHVEDISFHQSLANRMAGVGDISIVSHDPSTPQLEIRAIPDARRVFDTLKDRIIAVKRQRGVIKMDTGS